jgi:hypothetical protein
MKSSDQVLESRGFTDESFDQQFIQKTPQELLQLLISTTAQERTAAAKLLSQHKNKVVIAALCQALINEKKLYTKLAICDALVAMGIKAVPHLMELLGTIGANQYKSLPNAVFQKNNYPLPRDIVARTVIRLGAPTLPYLENILREGNRNKISEAIDAIGYIAFYTKNMRSLPVLNTCLQKYTNDELITWKIIRAFESYPDMAVKKYLTVISKDTQRNKMLRAEAKRSLKQLGL